MCMINIPFVDLHAQYLSIKDEIDSAIAAIIATSAFVRGPVVEAFEEEYAELMGAEYCVSCANGTDAIYIGMHALGIKPGDEVITTAQSWISTSETISQHGARPVFVDIDPVTHNIDPKLIEARITERTVGIIPVHLYGQPAAMPEIMNIAERHGLWVIEDCAQAHLASVTSKKVGQFGNIATWSFYPGKNLGAMGDAGAATTNDPALARKMARFARHGGIMKGEHEIEGINSRLDGIQAAILRVKMRYLEQWTSARQAAASHYHDQLGKISGIECPQTKTENTHVYHLYVIQHEQRDALAEFLKLQGVPTVINYRTALPFLPAYEYLGLNPDDFPVARKMQDRILSLPIFAEISLAQQQKVIESIAKFGSAGA